MHFLLQSNHPVFPDALAVPPEPAEICESSSAKPQVSEPNDSDPSLHSDEAGLHSENF